MRWWPILLGGVLPLLAGGRQAAAAEDAPKGLPATRWAVLIGVSKYQSPAFPELTHCAAEQQALAAELDRHRYFVSPSSEKRKEKEWSAPTKVQIDGRLDALANTGKDVAVLLFFFSGHGVEINGQNYLCPADADPADPKTLISVQSVYARLDKCLAASKLVILDACRREVLDSASPPERRSSAVLEFNPSSAKVSAEHRNMELWTSCSVGEVAYIDSRLNRGVFTHYLIDGLAGKVRTYQPDRIMSSELRAYVFSQTSLHMSQLGKPQNPYQSSNATDFKLTERLAAQLPDEETNTLAMKLRLIRPLQPRFQMGATDLKLADYRKNNFRNQGLSSPNGAFSDEADDEGKLKWADVPKEYYIGATEVTVAQFREFVTAKDTLYTQSSRPEDSGFGIDPQGRWRQDPKYSWKDPGFPQADDHPVVNVSWEEAESFCRWLNKKEGKEYRLPTEAEWECASRAGAESQLYSNGNDPNAILSIANIADSSLKEVIEKERKRMPPPGQYARQSDSYPFTAPVKRFLANAAQLYDMHGNVAEWCKDWYTPRYRKEGGEASSGTQRVVRGGSWYSTPWEVRSTARDGCLPDKRSLTIGFRVVMLPK